MSSEAPQHKFTKEVIYHVKCYSCELWSSVEEQIWLATTLKYDADYTCPLCHTKAGITPL